MSEAGKGVRMDRRQLLIGGGAGIGLIVAWRLWPRRYAPNLTAIPGETIFGAWLKIGSDGHVAVAVPQAEYGQGSYTALPQIIADELGADWRTIAVEPAPLNPLYANPLATAEVFEGGVEAGLMSTLIGDAASAPMMLTGGSTSVRAFEGRLRQAGAAARVLLCKAAAARWGVDWQQCATDAGFVTHAGKTLRFAELASEAAGHDVPEELPMRIGEVGRLTGEPLPRLDVPAKVDGSANFAGDIRLPGMVFAAIRQGPIGDSRLVHVDRVGAKRVPGVVAVVETDRWVAAVAKTWWAANRALGALSPRFETRFGEGRPRISSASIDAALDAALRQPGQRIAKRGDLASVFAGGQRFGASYRVAPAMHAAIETTTATANLAGGQLQLWLATQAPALARGAAARAAGLSESAVVVHPMLIGGSFGAALETHVAEQAALLAVRLKRPVQLVWSRDEDAIHDRYRPPAAARMEARLGANGVVLGWHARIAAPPTGRELARRLLNGDSALTAMQATAGQADPYAVAGATPIYRFPAYAIDHHVAEIGAPTGHWRSGAHSYTAFFTECFVDELAHVSGTEPLSFRVANSGDPRLVRCLSTAAALGGWEGGVAGSGQGIACHSFRGSHIAVLAEAHFEEGVGPQVDRLVAAVDCGRQINPDLVRQQIEGGLIFGMAAALAGSTGFADNVPTARRLGALRLPRLADCPDITVELIRSDAAPGGVSELAVPPVAPAIANALAAASGSRLRHLPLSPAA